MAAENSAAAAQASAIAAELAAVETADRMGDVDGDGRPDMAQLQYLGGYAPNNWRLVVDMTRLGQQSIVFGASAVFPLMGPSIPRIVGSADADRDGRAEVFVRVGSGASTEFWTIFKLDGPRFAQVSTAGQPIRLAVGGSVTHQDGFRCNGTQFQIFNEAEQRPGSPKWTFEVDNYLWLNSTLGLVSKQTGQVSGQPSGNPPAYRGVACAGVSD